MPEFVVDLCNSPYSNLKPYFENITLKDISLFDEDDIMQGIPVSYKILGRIFCRKILYAYLKKGDTEFIEMNKKEMDESNLFKYMDPEKVLNLRGIVTTSNWEGISYNKIVLPSSFSSFHENIKYIDLSRNCLTDAEMPKLLSFLQSIKIKMDCIDISHNRFYNSNSFGSVAELLNLNKTKMLVITENPFVSIDNKALFGSLTENQLEHLIWIQEKWLDAGNWKTMIKKEFCDAVECIHLNFYKKYSSK